MEALNDFPLRPLGIGEIFDRAVTIYVKNFVLFTLIMLTMLAPVGVVRIWLMPDPTTFLGKISSKSPGLPPEFWSWYGGILTVALVVLILTPFVTNAVAMGVAALYSGKKPTYGQSFGSVLRRWLPLLGTAFVNFMMVIAIYIFGAIVLGIFIGIGIALVQAALPVAVLIFVLASALGIAYLLFLLVMIVAYSFSLFGSTIEGQGVIAAIGAGYSRVFNKGELKKAVLVALSFAGVYLGLIILSAIVEFFLMFVAKSMPLTVAVGTAINAMFSSFTTILLAVYYYDVRTRAEGLDLEVDLTRLTAQ
jgi:hypothetical protein